MRLRFLQVLFGCLSISFASVGAAAPEPEAPSELNQETLRMVERLRLLAASVDASWYYGAQRLEEVDSRRIELARVPSAGQHHHP